MISGDISIAQNVSLKLKMVAMYIALFQFKTFPSRFAFENIVNNAKTDLVTLAVFILA